MKPGFTISLLDLAPWDGSNHTFLLPECSIASPRSLSTFIKIIIIFSVHYALKGLADELVL